MLDIARLGILLLLSLAPAIAAQDTPKRPNILLILSDDMGYGDLGCYGSTQIATPAIDALATGGVRLTQGYVTAPVCAPSRAGLITGRYQNRFGFEHNLAYPDHVAPERIGLPLTERTLGDRLGALGYRTALVGKWHLGKTSPAQQPNARGFDRFFGMLKGSHGYFPKAEKNALYRDGKPVTKIRTPYLTDWFTDEAIDWLRADHGGAPWFLYLAYNTPHTPLQAKPEDLAAFPTVEPRKRRIYCAMQRNLDHNVGRLVTALRETKQLANTLLVFLNDNGGSVDASFALNAPLRGQKSTYLEGGIRIPWIMHWPAQLPRGAVYRKPVTTVDLLPTLLAVAGGNMPEEWIGRGRRRRRKTYDGVNLVPWLLGKRNGRPHETLYWRMVLRGAAIRQHDWKLIRLPHRPPMLFDLATDPSELSDRAREHPDRVCAMLLALHEWECSFETNPMWISAVSWASYNRKLYDRQYELKQR